MPLTFSSADSTTVSGGLLVIRAAEGTRPVLHVEVKGRNPFLSTRARTALVLQGVTDARFHDPVAGGYFFTQQDQAEATALGLTVTDVDTKAGQPVLHVNGGIGSIDNAQVTMTFFTFPVPALSLIVGGNLQPLGPKLP